MTDEQRDKKMQLLMNQVSVLMQSFDTVQIFCSKHEDTETFQYQTGNGNFLARYGQVRGWLVAEDARNAGFHNDDTTRGEKEDG